MKSKNRCAGAGVGSPQAAGAEMTLASLPFRALLVAATALLCLGQAASAQEGRAETASSEEGAGTAGDEGAEAAGDEAEAEEPAAAEEERPSIIPQISAPRFELPGSKAIEVEGLRRPTTQREEMPERAQPVDVGFSVESISHARSHGGSARGCVPRNRIEGFRLPDFPAQVEPFTSCIRFSAERAVIARLQARILDPSEREVADADGEISFAGGGKTIDFVISWAGFPARSAGTYEIVLELERREVGRFPLEVATR